MRRNTALALLIGVVMGAVGLFLFSMIVSMRAITKGIGGVEEGSIDALELHLREEGREPPEDSDLWNDRYYTAFDVLADEGPRTAEDLNNRLKEMDEDHFENPRLLENVLKESPHFTEDGSGRFHRVS